MATDKLIKEKNRALYEAGRKLEHIRVIGYFLQELPEGGPEHTPCDFDPHRALGALLFDLGDEGAKEANEALEYRGEDSISQLVS